MENLEKILNKIENNFHNKNKKETVDYKVGDEIYKVHLLTRDEKADLIFSVDINSYKTFGEIYNWLKPTIYKSFQLKEVAVKAKEQGFIKSYYEVIDMLFSIDEIAKIVSFIMEINNLQFFMKDEVEFQKKP